MVVSWQPSRTCLLRSKRNGSHGTAINAAINLQVSVFAAIDDQLLSCLCGRRLTCPDDMR